MANDNQNPFYRDLKEALVANRFDKKAKLTAGDKLATLERRLDREKLTNSEIEDIRKQIRNYSGRLRPKHIKRN